MTNLYRIVSFESFVNTCLFRKERFVNPIDCWEDTYEGYMLHRLDSRKGTEEVVEYLYNNLFDHNPKYTINNYVKLQRARYSCYGQFWSLLPDSDALWRIYSYNNHAIQIRSTAMHIKKMIDDNGISGMSRRIERVQYSEDCDDISNILYQGSRTDDPFFYKRSEFQHEQECRVILQLTDMYKSYALFAAQALLINFNKNSDKNVTELQRIVNTINDAKTGVYNGADLGIYSKDFYIGINNIDDYILGVRVHPLAENWYVSLIEEFCKTQGLVFEGKSQLYRDII